MFTKRSFFKFISLSVIFLSIMSCSQLSSKTSSNAHFWEKDGAWFYIGTKRLVENKEN